MFILIVFLMCLLAKTEGKVIPNYKSERMELIAQETLVSVGGTIQLSAEENVANDILMNWKHKELDEAFNNPQYFNLSKHYFTYRDDIETSKVYQIIRRMPKGAALHIHSSMMLDVDGLIKLTYEPNLYICFSEEDFKLLFSLTPPREPCKQEWTLLNLIRNMSENVTRFDNELKLFFSMHTQDPELYINSDINTVWNRFEKVISAIKGLISYRPVREKYIYEALKRFYDDNILYVEVRTGLHGLYELDGTTHDRNSLAELYRNVTNKFIEDHPDFIGVKLILTKHRKLTESQIRDAVRLVRSFKAEMPDMIAGFDLVGQEDLGKPLSEYLPALMEAKNDVDYFFHAGESAWYGTPSDENLYDAILLGSKRIGHAYALAKHPALIQAIIKNNIAIEVNVISNNVLSLIHDVRNHPLATFLSVGLPVVLSSDDPGAWGADPLSHDFFVAFMGVASRHADLRLLKQLALNSIQYSALEDRRKTRLRQIFDNRWAKFINDLIKTHAHSMSRL